MDYLDITFATNPLILDTFLDDFAMDPIILDILLSDDATWSTGSDDGDEVFWTMVFVPFEMLAAFFLLVPVWYLIRAYWDNLLELPRLLATLVYWIWTMIYRGLYEIGRQIGRCCSKLRSLASSRKAASNGDIHVEDGECDGDSYKMDDIAVPPRYVSHDSVMGPLPVYDPRA